MRSADAGPVFVSCSRRWLALSLLARRSISIFGSAVLCVIPGTFLHKSQRVDVSMSTITGPLTFHPLSQSGFSTMEHLRKELKSIRRSSKSCSTNGRRYIPYFAFKTIITHENILDVVRDIREIPAYRRDFITAVILEKTPKIFSILVLLRLPKLIVNFLYRREHDSRLPLAPEALKGIASDLNLTRFAKYQEEFLAPIFSRGDLHYELSPGSVLPFQEDKYLNAGGFGKVFAVVLDHQHHEIGHATDDEVSE